VTTLDEYLTLKKGSSSKKEVKNPELAPQENIKQIYNSGITKLGTEKLFGF